MFHFYINYIPIPKKEMQKDISCYNDFKVMFFINGGLFNALAVSEFDIRIILVQYAFFERTEPR